MVAGFDRRVDDQLCRHVKLSATLATFLTGNIAQSYTDKDGYRNTHPNADPHDFFVDTHVGAFCVQVMSARTRVT